MAAASAALTLGTASASADTLPFSPTSFWNDPVAPTSPVDPNSARFVAALGAEVASDEAAGIGPWLSALKCGVTVYTVPAGQPTVRVQVAYPRVPGFQDQFDAVPLPPNAQPSNCSDHHLSLWQPSTDTIWDFWKLTRLSDGSWKVYWGGRMTHASSNPGYFGPKWGATATSLPLLGGLIRLSDVRAGVIPHAVAFAVAYPMKGIFSWPAQRTDGRNTDPNALPEGIRFRLDPTLDIGALNLPPLTRMIAEAVQRYGMVLRDGTHTAVGFYGEQPKPGDENPYPSALAGLTMTQAMEKFPWSYLQALPLANSDCSAIMTPAELPPPGCSLFGTPPTGAGSGTPGGPNGAGGPGPSGGPQGGAGGRGPLAGRGRRRHALVLRATCYAHGVQATVGGAAVKSVRSVTFRAFRRNARDRRRPFRHRWALRRGRHRRIRVNATARMRGGSTLRLTARSPRCRAR